MCVSRKGGRHSSASVVMGFEFGFGKDEDVGKVFIDMLLDGILIAQEAPAVEGVHSDQGNRSSVMRGSSAREGRSGVRVVRSGGGDPVPSDLGEFGLVKHFTLGVG